jgi:hypothetical protein
MGLFQRPARRKIMAQAPNSRELDEHLSEVVGALYGAVRQGISHLNDPSRVEQAIGDCKEILDEVMAGKTAEWLKGRED